MHPQKLPFSSSPSSGHLYAWSSLEALSSIPFLGVRSNKEISGSWYPFLAFAQCLIWGTLLLDDWVTHGWGRGVLPGPSQSKWPPLLWTTPVPLSAFYISLLCVIASSELLSLFSWTIKSRISSQSSGYHPHPTACQHPAGCFARGTWVEWNFLYLVPPLFFSLIWLFISVFLFLK